jgi:hypothetical protein
MAKEKNLSRVTENESGVQGQYKNWFLDYASYVILERAVPAIEDGLKPVQRRILHAMKEMDDGRFNKVANIIGQSMQYHPHGDVAIYDSMVRMAQDFVMMFPLVNCHGNFGSVDDDPPAAMRYTNCKLSPLCSELIDNIENIVPMVDNFDNTENIIYDDFMAVKIDKPPEWSFENHSRFFNYYNDEKIKIIHLEGFAHNWKILHLLKNNIYTFVTWPCYFHKWLYELDIHSLFTINNEYNKKRE